MTGLRARVLGGLAVEGVAMGDLGSRKGRTLLKVLLLARGQPVATDRLADVLWGDRPPASPADQVGVLVSRLRRVLGADRLPRTDGGYACVVAWLDVDELRARTVAASDALAAGRTAVARAAATAALELAVGEVLPEEDGDWVEPERVAARALVGEATRLAAEAALGAGDHGAAAAAAEAALAADPYDEAVLRVLMRAHQAAGRPGSALAAYARVRERLADDLGVPPTADTEALHDAIVLADAAPTGPAPAAPGPVGPVAVLPGRETELAELDAALDRAVRHGRAQAVVVVGEGGIGKSALLDAWVRRAGDAVVALVGRGSPVTGDLPLQPLLVALQGRLALLAPADRADLLGPEAAELDPLLAAGRTTGPADDGAGPTSVADPALGRARLFAALGAVAVRAARARPVVLAVDDAHLADPATLAWLEYAAALPAPLVLLVLSRPPAPVLRDARRLVLPPLDRDAVEAVVGRDRVEDLFARTGGHPLLLAALSGPGSDDASSLAEAVARRVHELGPGADTLRAAAALGPEVDLDLLAAVRRIPVEELLDHLETAAVAGLLVERGTAFAFRHDLEREELERSLTSARRALLHRDAARALAHRPDADPLAVATHARRGGDLALATEWYVRAAQVATDRHDVEAAEAVLSTALAAQDTPEARQARARARIALGRLDDAADDASRAAAADGGAASHEVVAWVAYYRRRYEEALAAAAAGERAATDPGLRASCLAVGGRVRHGTGDVAGATAALEAAVAEPAPEELTGVAQVWLAQARLHQGRPEEALAALDRVGRPDRLAHPFAPLHGRFARAMALGQLGRVGAGLAACDELDRAVADAGAAGARFRGPAANVRAWLLRWSGQVDAADDANRVAVAVAAGGAMEEAWYAGLLDLADGRLLAGDLDGAAARADELAGLPAWRGTMAWHQRHRHDLLRARLAQADGDADAAVELAVGVAADAGARGAERYRCLAVVVGAELGGPADATAVQDAVAGLGRCAGVDGWWALARLAAVRPDLQLGPEAEARAAAVVGAAPDPASARRLVRSVL